MHSNTPKVSVIIRCLNEELHLARLFKGIAAQTLNDVELILVDSGSNDSSRAIAQSFGARVMNIAPSEFSFGRSLNVGCEAASGDILVLASAHVYPVSDTWLETLIDPLADPNVALTYGMQRGTPTTYFSEHQIFKRWFPDESCADQEHPFCNNANAAIRKSQWESQKYDEDITGLEDLDWATKAQKAGYKVAYVAEAPVIHVHNESFKKIMNRYRREAVAYKRLTGDHQLGFWHCLGLSIGSITSDCFHAAMTPGHRTSAGSVFKFRTAQYWGTYKGSRQRGAVSSELRKRFYYPERLRNEPTDAVTRIHGTEICYQD